LKIFKNKLEKFNSSVIIALLAVLISSVSAFISLKEAKILQSQQKIMQSQKEASVWPYMENSHSITKINDSSYMITYTSTNKGVGPAIIDSVNYWFKNIEFKNWELAKTLKELYPNLVIKNHGNAELGNKVLTAHENLITFKISVNKTNYYDSGNYNILVNQIAQGLYLRYCYCSVYGKCWKVNGEKIERCEECSFKNEIR